MTVATPPGAAPTRPALPRLLLTILVWIVLTPIVAFLLSWTSLALYFSNIPFEPVRTFLGFACAIGFVLAFLFVTKRLRTLKVFLISFGVMLIYWWMIPASNDKDWLPEYAKLAKASFDGDQVKVHNVRNFDYRSAEDFTVAYYDRSFSMKNVETVDFLLSYWDGNTAIAHSMYSFNIKGAEPLCVSVESRRDKNTTLSLLGGIFRQTTLIYVLGHERDLVRVRTNFRGEEVYLYPTNSTPEQAQTLLRFLLDKTNRLYEQPRFYNIVFDNCSTNLIPDGDDVIDPLKLDYRALFNGYADRMAYDAGWLKTDDSFEVTKQRHHINQYVESGAEDLEFSRLIRPHQR